MKRLWIGVDVVNEEYIDRNRLSVSMKLARSLCLQAPERKQNFITKTAIILEWQTR